MTQLETLSNSLFATLSDYEASMILGGTGKVMKTFTSDGSYQGDELVLD